MLRTVTATRYVTPLREGGSLPGLVEADDDGLYVVKFRGAGQGPKALAAEIVAGELARSLGLPVPELVFVELDPELARAEPDPEIQDLIRASAGLNLAHPRVAGQQLVQQAAGLLHARTQAEVLDLADGVVARGTLDVRHRDENHPRDPHGRPGAPQPQRPQASPTPASRPSGPA